MFAGNLRVYVGSIQTADLQQNIRLSTVGHQYRALHGFRFDGLHTTLFHLQADIHTRNTETGNNGANTQCSWYSWSRSLYEPGGKLDG